MGNKTFPWNLCNTTSVKLSLVKKTIPMWKDKPLALRAFRELEILSINFSISSVILIISLLRYCGVYYNLLRRWQEIFSSCSSISVMRNKIIVRFHYITHQITVQLIRTQPSSVVHVMISVYHCRQVQIVGTPRGSQNTTIKQQQQTQHAQNQLTTMWSEEPVN